MDKINSIKKLEEYFKKNNFNSSNDLGNLGLDYYNQKLKPIINPKLFQKPNNKKELQKLINDNFPLFLIDTFNIINIKNLFNIYYSNKKFSKYWENPLNYLGFWNTSNVTDISYCFYRQSFFNQKIYWDISNVENAEKLFFYCTNFNQPVELNLLNCKNISEMFSDCGKFNSSIKLNNLNNIEDASNLFSYCNNLNQPIKLDLSNCQDISWMFSGCEKLNKPIELNNLNNVKNIANLFLNCDNLEFNNIELVINQLISKVKNINKLDKKIKYKIPKEYKKKIKNKLIGIINQI